jgi:hypothetical protein
VRHTYAGMTAPITLNALLVLHQCCTNTDFCPKAHY